LKSKLFFILVSVAIGGYFPVNTWATTDKIAVIMSRHIPPFDLALEGFQETVKCPCEIHDIVMAEMSERKAIREIIKNSPPRMILAVGSRALQFAQDNFPHLPIVFTMVTNPSRIVKRRQNTTGVRMETPWAKMFEYLEMITHRYKRVGIILNQRRTKEETELVKDLAGKYGFEPILRTVKNSSEAISKFKNIEDKIEAFLMAPDLYILTPKFYEYILLSSLRYKFVLVGLSPKYTKAGSLFSVMGDNRDWGVQAGLIANDILSGADPGLIPYGFAQDYSLSINLKTADRIGVEINRAVKQKADFIVK
jgi:putative ABC transport system substrate-binding protein